MTSATLSDTATTEAVIPAPVVKTDAYTYTGLGDDAEVAAHVASTGNVSLRAYTKDFGLGVLDLRMSPKAARNMLNELGRAITEAAEADTAKVNA